MTSVAAATSTGEAPDVQFFTLAVGVIVVDEVRQYCGGINLILLPLYALLLLLPVG